MGAKKTAKTRKEKLASSRAIKIKRRLVNAAGKTPEILLVQFDNSYDGFDGEQVEEMRDEYGENSITKQKKESWYGRMFHAFFNPFTVILILIGAFMVTLDSDIIGGGIIFAMVAFSGMLKFVQETRNSVAAEKLTGMVETTVHVRRKILDEDIEEDISRKVEIPLDELVVGDVLYLAAGDMIPADVRILKAKDLFVSQASLTGESEPVEKLATAGGKKGDNPLDLNNLAFMGTNVVSGTAVALVLAVGDDTIFGGIARQLQTKKTVTSFDKGINSVSWVLIRLMLIMVPFVFVVSGLRNGAWMNSLFFALAVAVGLTPEMLPLVVSATLAKGAVFMSRKKVIVKDLSSIQNFGAMNILCTDKTGTLTQDKVILQYHLDVHGQECKRVLRHAYLNSYYQTGLKNLMDMSVIERAGEEGITNEFRNWTKIDEIPFDFQRRRMSVVVAGDKSDGKTRLITKGAIEEMLSICDRAEYKGKIVTIDADLKKEILERANQYNADGMRVVGVAQKKYNHKDAPTAFSVKDEKHMVLTGLLAFLDPPKETARAAIQALSEYGVQVKVLTGDNDAVTSCVCRQVGLAVGNILLGSDIEKMSDDVLCRAVEQTNVFAKLSPDQKARIVRILRRNGHIVGFMGDGINDAAAMRAADVGISVENAVDIAKEAASIILLEKDLMILEQGVIEGRKIYGNIVKYIKMTASSNFGNMFSVLVAAAFLPFLPMLPIQILMLNLIYDLSCASIPWDNVDKEFLKKPRAWEAKSIMRFTLWFGPTSSVFDITTYIVMFWLVCPKAMGGQSYSDLAGVLSSAQAAGDIEAIRLAEASIAKFQAIFQTGWFVESLATQTLVIHILRSPRFPFIRTRASWQVTMLTSVGIAAGIAIPFIPFISEPLQLAPLVVWYFAALAAIVLLYLLLVTLFKYLFVKRYKELL